jgi:hypothetical protein
MTVVEPGGSPLSHISKILNIHGYDIKVTYEHLIGFPTDRTWSDNIY